MRATAQRAAGAFVLLALLAFARGAAADYRQSYLDGRVALARGDAASAVPLLAAAAAEKPREQARARLVGVIPEPYLPHHFLGLAYARLGRCAEALREWETSAAQGVVAGLAEPASEARAGIAECRRRLGVLDPQEARAQARSATRLDLARALETFLAGDYARAVERLEVLPTPEDPNSRAWQLAVRSAARHALYRLGGAQDASLLAGAMADARDARRADPTFRPSPDLFSPRFLELWSRER